MPLQQFHPTPRHDHRRLRVVSVGGDVLTCDVGDELLEPIPFPIQDQTDLAPLVTGAEASGTDKEPKLEWHVEAGQLIDGIELRPGDVVYAETARANDREDLLDPDLARVVDLQGAAWHVATVKRCED